MYPKYVFLINTILRYYGYDDYQQDTNQNPDENNIDHDVHGCLASTMKPGSSRTEGPSPLDIDSRASPTSAMR